MSKRSKVSTGAIIKQFANVARHPWIAGKLAALQGEKWIFNYLYPKYKEGQANKIRQVSIRITDMCNLRCIMCGQWGDTGFLHDKDLKELKKEEVPVDRYIELMRDLKNHNHHPNLYLWGGEPTMYDGWLELIEEATRLKMPCSIATNGKGMTSYAERIVKAPMFLLQVSVDGHNAEVHNKIRRGTGKTNSFQMIMDGLDAVIEERKSGKGLPLIATLTTVSKENCNHLVDIYETFRDKADICVFYPAWWIDEERADAHEEDFKRRFDFAPELHRGWVGGWKLDDYAGLSRQLAELDRISSSMKNPPVIFIPNIRGVDNLKSYYTDHTARFGFDQCISIYQVVEIDSNGNMSPCRDYHDYVVGNVKDNTITEIWNNEKYKRFRKSLSTEGLMPVCSRCCGLMGY